jgi:hydrogenase expression/formation protein HypC
MCLGIPGRLVEKVEGYGGQLALVDVLGQQRRVNLGMLEDADQTALTPGEWVIIHMGFVVERVDAATAEKAMAGLEMMGRARAPEAPPTTSPSPGLMQ